MLKCVNGQPATTSKKKMATVTENLKLLTTSTMDEDKQFLTEVIEEIKIKKTTR